MPTFAETMTKVRDDLEWDVRGWWRVKEKGSGTPDRRRFLAPRLIDTESCTHTLGLPGCRCPFCGGTVPADG